MSVADETYELPRASWDRDWPGEDYAKAFHKLVWTLNPDLVHAQTDVEVRALSRFRNVAKPARYMLPSHDTVCACQDKFLSYNRWKGHVPVPDTYLVRGRESIFNFLQKYGEGWLRLRQGGGGAGAIRVDKPEFAREWVNRYDGWGKFTIAEVLNGPSVTWQSLWRKGELVSCQQRKRVSWANARNSPSGVSGSTGVGETVYDALVGSTAERACLAIDPKPHGLFAVDMTYHDEVPVLTEINVGRFFTTAPEFFLAAGFNMADLYVQTATQVDLPLKRLNPLPQGLRWVRSMDREPVLA